MTETPPIGASTVKISILRQPFLVKRIPVAGRDHPVFLQPIEKLDLHHGHEQNWNPAMELKTGTMSELDGQNRTAYAEAIAMIKRLSHGASLEGDHDTARILVNTALLIEAVQSSRQQGPFQIN